MVDYNNAKVYRLVAGGLQYIGSTVESLAKRKSGHKRSYNSWKNGTYHWVTSFLLFDTECDVDIVLIENYPCSSKEELHARERYWIENIEGGCVNRYHPTRTNKEYIDQHRDHLLQCMKQYRENNKEKVQESNRKWYEENKDKVKQYREQNKDHIRQQEKEYKERNKEQIRLKQKERYERKNGPPKIRQRGSGGLRQIPNGKWRVVISKNKIKTDKTFDTKEEAENFILTANKIA